ncbi:hypothetical protein TNCV_2097081 [Trichonephila clavipes]|nr:hypothetical protein TNCV_2097081 [Trichonephila clavipes]
MGARFASHMPSITTEGKSIKNPPCGGAVALMKSVEFQNPLVGIMWNDAILEIIGEWRGNALCSPIKAVSFLMSVMQWRNGEYWRPSIKSAFGLQAIVDVSQALEP